MAELIIDRNYYNKLDIEGFSKMMSSPSYSYKFYWLEAIVQLISANRTEVTYDEIINKMIVNAWFPVQEYHIHLSGIYGEGEVKDNLEKAVSRLFKLSDLPSNADEIQIINKLNEFSDDKELHFYKTELVEDVCIELQDINKILEKANAHVGYRVRDEIVFYMLNNKNAGNLLTRNQAFDHEIMQKILPRIQGSSASVKIMLCELFKYCAGDYESYQTESDDVSAKMMAAANKETCKYKESAKKIAFMVRRFEEDGFTAYWL